MIKHPDLIYDVGMHKGEDTHYYLAKGYRVIGFEADPILAAHCRKRFATEIDCGRLAVVEGAIAKVPPGETPPATVTFFRNQDVSVWGTVVNQWAQRNELLGTSNEIIEVPTVTFSDYLSAHGIPHYLKIDIEGMDTACLRALQAQAHRPDYVSIESEMESFDRLLEEFDLLVRLGYTKFQAIQQVGIPRQREPDPSREGPFLGYHFQEGSTGLFGCDLPGEWQDFDQIVREYRGIFRLYKLFGNNGVFARNAAGKLLRSGLRRIFGEDLPGWYDTHAKHSSVVP